MAENESLDLDTADAKRWDTVFGAVKKVSEYTSPKWKE
jgi:hypothetical protein